LPERALSVPRWLRLEHPHALGPLAMLDLGVEARELSEPPFGNNMAIERKCLRSTAVFEPS